MFTLKGCCGTAGRLLSGQPRVVVLIWTVRGGCWSARAPPRAAAPFTARARVLALRACARIGTMCRHTHGPRARYTGIDRRRVGRVEQAQGADTVGAQGRERGLERGRTPATYRDRMRDGTVIGLRRPLPCPRSATQLRPGVANEEGRVESLKEPTQLVVARDIIGQVILPPARPAGAPSRRPGGPCLATTRGPTRRTPGWDCRACFLRSH